MKVLHLISLCLIANVYSFSQEKVSFYTTDSLKITADLYLSEISKPFILLFHQAGSSRGEYKDIAPRLVNLNYNCLAVDLRTGGESNYIHNESAKRARNQKKAGRFIDALKDIDAAIGYVSRFNNEAIILLGSSYTASLCLLKGHKTDKVKAVVAFSPGEYFRPHVEIKNSLKGFSKPVFLGATNLEYAYVKKLYSEIESSLKILYYPSNGRGVHGAKALWDDSDDSKDCWLQLIYFFKSLQDI